MQSLSHLFEWSQNTWLANAIHGSTWLFPAIETAHILGLTVLLGTVLAIDLRLLNLVMPNYRVSLLAKNLAPWTWTGLAVSVLTGVPMLCSEALKCYGNDAFRAKVVILLMAIVFHVTAFRRVTSEGAKIAPAWGRLTAVLSLALWYGVGVTGRAIGFI